MKNKPEAPLEPDGREQLIPREGWVALHLFYQIDRVQWTLFTEDEKLSLKTNLTRLAQEIRAMPDTQLLLFSVVSPKADLGVLLLTPDLHDANAFEKRLGGSLGTEILTPVYSYLSLTTNDGFASNALYPKLPDSPVVGFYSMSCRRGEHANWYSLGEKDRATLLHHHRAALSPWEDSVSRLVTASTGLDDGEWAVTLFTHDLLDLKNVIHESRFDPFSAQYVDFGEFYVGIQLPLDELFRRLDL
ncbi:MAG: chlorite dismutase family protein [Verrucomicrobiota bacterium]